MASSLRARLWLSYALIIVTALGVVAMVLFISILRSPLSHRQTAERLSAVRTVLVERLQEAQAPSSFPTQARRAARTFGIRVLLFSADGQFVFDSLEGQEATMPFPQSRGSILRSIPVVRDENGTTWLYSMQELEDGTFLVVASPRPRLSILTIFGDEFLPVIFLSGGISLLLSLFAAFLFSMWIATPLQKIINAAQEMPSAELAPVDVTGPHEVQELTRAFNAMAARVQASQRSQREFVANVSHELKTPLTSIQGFAQAILDGTAESHPARRQAAGVIYNEAERMRRMVLDLLDLAKLDAGMADLKMGTVNITALLNAVAEKFAPQSRQAGVGIEVKTPADLPALIADGDRMAQVFANLLDNALKFSPAGGAVSLTAELDGTAHMKVTVADAGAGIAQDEAARIFQRFYQADPARKGGETHGAGLGLAIAHEIVAAHGGKINVQSQVGRGTTMEVFLPLAPPELKKVRHKSM